MLQSQKLEEIQHMCHVNFDLQNTDVEEYPPEQRMEERNVSTTRQLKYYTKEIKRAIKSPSFWVLASLCTSLYMMMFCAWYLIKRHNKIENGVEEKELQIRSTGLSADFVIFYGFGLLFILSAINLVAIPRSELFWVYSKSSSYECSDKEGQDGIPLRSLTAEATNQNAHSVEDTVVMRDVLEKHRRSTANTNSIGKS